VKKSPESHFRTDHLLTNLGQRAVSGGFVTASAQAVKFILNLGSTVLLARLLSPQDFGLVAMAGALMPILRTFREGGLSTATVQKEGITHAQVSNLFWINLALGGMITAIGSALAPAVAWFYKDDRLTVVTILLSLSFLLSGAAVQHLALLNRQMRFKAVAFIDIASSSFGFLVGVVLAWCGFGYWSLVGMQLSVTLAEVLLTWFASGWLPQLPQRKSGTRPLLHFGASMTIYILLRRLAGSMDVILLGRYAGVAAVGLYTRALVLLLRPLDQFIAPFDTVFIPMLSRLQGQPERYRQVFLQVYGAIALLSFGFAGLLIGLSKPLVLLLLGAKWAAVIPIFSWLTIAALYIPLSYSAMWLLTTQGRSKDLMVMGVTVTVLTVLSVGAGLPFGTTGLAMSLSLVGLFIRLPVQYQITGKSGPVSRGDLWGVFFRHLPLWVAVGVATWSVQIATASLSSWSQAILAGLAGAAVGVGVVAALPNLRSEVMFIFEQTQRFLQRRREPAA
jgi:PST family polysaccharide transporter